MRPRAVAGDIAYWLRSNGVLHSMRGCGVSNALELVFGGDVEILIALQLMLITAPLACLS